MAADDDAALAEGTQGVAVKAPAPAVGTDRLAVAAPDRMLGQGGPARP